MFLLTRVSGPLLGGLLNRLDIAMPAPPMDLETIKKCLLAQSASGGQVFSLRYTLRLDKLHWVFI
jgi:hypothetical protein